MYASHWFLIFLMLLCIYAHYPLYKTKVSCEFLVHFSLILIDQDELRQQKEEEMDDYCSQVYFNDPNTLNFKVRDVSFGTFSFFCQYNPTSETLNFEVGRVPTITIFQLDAKVVYIITKLYIDNMHRVGTKENTCQCNKKEFI